ncbi:MAG: hypothetical protein KC777_10540 [Cyanobacteria bacterium HKST-UBA02]|nr:hypothetical protein [Cyanobacteria bacterium HKST-UBA02]
MRRNRATTSLLLLLVALAGVSLGRSYADTPTDDQRWREERERRFELVDQEKALLRESDALSKRMFELKRAIDQLHANLSACQQKYESVNHRLITVQMMLLK